MIRKIALAAIFFQVAMTAALATQLVLQERAGDGMHSQTLDFATPVSVAEKRPTHTILVLSPDAITPASQR